MHPDHDPREREPRLRRRVVTATIALALVAPALATQAALPAAAADCSTVPWMDAAKTPEARAAALLDASSQHQIYRWLVEQPANSPQQTTFSGVTYPVQVECTPTVVYTDGPDGVRFTAGVTAFPAPIAVGVDVEHRPGRAEGRGAGRRGLRQGQERRARPGARGRAHAALRPHPRVLRRGRAAHRPPHRRHRQRPRGRQPRQAGDLRPQALRGERAGARPPDELLEHRRAHLPRGVQPPVRDRAQPQHPREHHVLVQPDQRGVRLREPDPERRRSRATSASRATSCPTSARCTRPRRRSWPDSTRS